MKKYRYLSLLLALVLGGGMLPVHAKYYKSAGSSQAGESFHFAYLSGGVGYTSLECLIPGVTPTGGLGAFGGLGYEFRNSGFWLSVGPQFGYHNSKLSLDQYVVDKRGADTEGQLTTFHYTINEQDVQNWLFIEVPVLAGWYFHGFHIGAGAKISYALSSAVYAQGTYALSATNDLTGIEFHDIPEQGYTTYEYKSNNQSATLRPLVSLVGEIGYDILSAVPTRSQVCNLLRVSFYFEYGLNSLVAPSIQSTRVVVNPNDATDAQINPYFTSSITDAQTYRVVPFFTGVKFTYLIGGSKHSKAGGFHKGCQCYNN